MKHFFLSLHMDLTESASDGAGWYLQVTTNEGVLLEPVSVSLEAAHQLASAAQTALQTTDGEIPSLTIPQLVKSASTLIENALAEQLQHAEEQASKITMLKRKLGQIPPRK